MKKLIMGIAAIAATTAMAEIVSSSVVGYQNKDTRSGYNYVTPTFRVIGSEAKTDIQELQLADSVSSNDSVMQFLAANSRLVAEYVWLDKDTAPAFGGTEGKGGWFVFDEDEGTFALPEPAVTLNTGDSVLIDMPAAALTMAGQVSDDDVTYVARSGYNYVGNAFPAALDIQNIQLADSVSSNDSVMQFLAANSRLEAEYVWLDKDTAPAFGGTEGKGGWFVFDEDEGVFLLPDPAVTLGAGEAVLVDAPASTITVLAPIEL